MSAGIRQRIAKESTVDAGGVNGITSVSLETDFNERMQLMKSDYAKQYLAKRQMNRGGLRNGKYETQAPTREGERPGSVYKADGYVRTIYDLIDLHYNFMPQAMGKTSGVSKANDPILTDTPGVHNEVYGSDVFVLLNSEQNIFGVLETRPWNKSGERIIDAFADAVASGGVEENATIGDGEDIETTQPDFDTFETSPRVIAHSFDVSQVEQLLAATDDDAIADDPFALLRQFFGEGLPDQQTGGGEHPKHINEILGQDATSVGSPASQNEILAVDQAIADSTEEMVAVQVEATGESLESLPGLGATYATRLQEQGIESLQTLTDANADVVAEVADVSTEQAEAWIDAARTTAN